MDAVICLDVLLVYAWQYAVILIVGLYGVYDIERRIFVVWMYMLFIV